jgi:hypothetical protein
MPNESYHPIPWWAIALIVVILTSQSMWLFTDARRRQKNRWFWGIWGLIQCPMPILFYTYFHIYRPYRKSKQHNE